ncbi:hypothetical protein BGZ63DRAFT_425744 [Mariannaea sp. PMI_226]|nr:hypothetical protein BGZ63DRAFT_425744 [Mariannaea sp. PMI_226]
MATSWNNLGLHAVVDHSQHGPSDHDPFTYAESLSPSQQSASQWPSPQPTTSTTPLNLQQHRVLTPPPPSHPNKNPRSLANIIVPTGTLSPRSPFSPTSSQSSRSSHSPRSPKSYHNSAFQSLRRSDFPSTPSVPSINSDPFATPRATTIASVRSGRTALRVPTSHGQRLETMPEHPYYDTPPGTSGGKGNENGNGNGGGNSPGAMEVAESSDLELSEGWRPEWLGRRIIGAFLVVFVSLAVVGEVVNSIISKKDWESNIPGLWTFGPIVVTSVLAMLWTRVETQALHYTPWMILQGEPTSIDETRRKQAHRTILLDYPSMGSIKALITGFRNRHHLVAASVATSLILRVQVVLSTGVFHAVVETSGDKVLKVRAGAVHCMVALFCLLFCILLPMMYHSPSKHGITTRDPTSLAGTAALLANSRHFLARLTGTGTAPMEVIATKLTGSWYTTKIPPPTEKEGELFQLKQLSGGLPIGGGHDGSKQSTGWTASYRPWTLGATVQVVSAVVSAMLLAGLWVIYSIRGGDNGIETSDSLFVLWTFLPTLVFTCVMILWDRIDIDTRRLTPLLKLTTERRSFKESLGLTYMNEFGLITAGKAMRKKDWSVFFKKWMAIFGWLMPIFTTGLFAINEIAQTANLHLRPETQFVSTTKSLQGAIDVDVVNSVLIKETPNYPIWTYQDLALPEFKLIDQASEWPLPDTTLSAKTTALQPTLNCSLLTLTEGAGSNLKCSPLDGSKSADICDSESSSYHVGKVFSSCSRLSSSYTLNYIWGDCGKNGTMSVMRCNESVLAVNVSMTLDTETLQIATGAIPLPDPTTQRDSGLAANLSSAYPALEKLVTDNSTFEGLDGFFRTLVTSRLDMRLERLFSVERQNSVMENIRLQHGILGAQVLNSDLVRRPIDATDIPLVDATVDYYISRLTQGKIQTFALTVLLGIAIIFGVLSLRTTHRGPALPKDPGSIAAQGSLLADSTLWWRLPEGAVWMDDDELERYIRRKTFRLGWHNLGNGGRAYGIGIVEDEGKGMSQMATPATQQSTIWPGSVMQPEGLPAMATNISGEMPIEMPADNPMVRRESGVVNARYISMEPGLYSYGDIPVGVFEKE